MRKASAHHEEHAYLRRKSSSPGSVSRAILRTCYPEDSAVESGAAALRRDGRRAGPRARRCTSIYSATRNWVICVPIAFNVVMIWPDVVRSNIARIARTGLQGRRISLRAVEVDIDGVDDEAGSLHVRTDERLARIDWRALVLLSPDQRSCVFKPSLTMMAIWLVFAGKVPAFSGLPCVCAASPRPSRPADRSSRWPSWS